MPLILIALLSFSTAAFAQWDKTDTWMLGGALGTMVVDWAQTRDLTRQYNYRLGSNCVITPKHFVTTAEECRVIAEPAYDERLNPFLPRHPSVGDVDKYFALAIVSTATIAYVLPPKPRRWFLGGVIVLESLVILHNHHLGLRVVF